MTDKLNDKAPLPCPFCGEQAFASTTLDGAHYVMCKAEDCWAMAGYLPTQADAIAAWNRRAPVALTDADGLEVAALDITKRIEREFYHDHPGGNVQTRAKVLGIISSAIQSRDETIARLARERDKAQGKLALIVDRVVYADSYGVPGSDFTCCHLCNGGSTPGIPFEHDAHCPVLAVERDYEQWFDDIRSAEDALRAAEARLSRAMEAMTPSADTKAAYMGEFHMGVTLRAGDEEEYRRVQIPWTSIKEIMAAIRARAAREFLEGAE